MLFLGLGTGLGAAMIVFSSLWNRLTWSTKRGKLTKIILPSVD